MKPYRKTCLSTFAGWLAVAMCMPAIAQQSANSPRLTRQEVLQRHRKQPPPRRCPRPHSRLPMPI